MSLATLALLLLAAPGVPHVPAAAAAPQTSEAADSFRGHLARLRGLGEVGRWTTVAAELDRLLAAHRDAPYVAPHAPEVVVLYERAAFFAERDPRRAEDPADLVEGELLAWDRASGRIVLRYRELPGDFLAEGGLLRHPLELRGPYRIEVEGRLPEATDEVAAPPQLLVCIADGANVQVVFGSPRVERDGEARWIPARIVANGPDGGRLLAERADTPLVAGERYSIAVDVGPTRIRASVGGRALLSAQKPGPGFGRVALLGCPDVAAVTLTGVANPAWLEGLADARRQAEHRAFRATWDATERVPGWILALLPERPHASRSGVAFTRPVPPAGAAHLARLAELQTAGRPDAGLAYLARLADGDLPPELARFFEALFAADLGRPDDALAAVEEALAAAEDFPEAAALRVRLLALLGRNEARAAVDALLATEPASAFARAECARALLRLGDPEAARVAVERALVAGIPRDALADVEALLVRALEGPAWSRVFEYRSAHFDVRSDLGRQVCFDAARELEAAHLYYRRRLSRLGSGAGGARRLVYVFSGRAGYDAYAAALFDRAPETTSGLYSPLLQQLLVWNQPDADETLRTLRHEGLHQYLDGLVRRPPTWLDEGLAEYFETIEQDRGAYVEGGAQPHHVTRLCSGAGWVPYERLFALDHAEFYADAPQHYAQSWALLHWLFSSGLAEQRLLQSLLDDLATGAPATELHARLLRYGDLDALVREHVAGLATE